METRPLITCQRTIAVMWMIAFASVLLLVIVQTNFGNVYTTAQGDDLQKSVWQWMLPAMTPTLLLVLGVLVNCELVPAARQEAQRRRVSSFFYRVTLSFSAFYLLLVALLPISTAFKDSALDRVNLLLQSNVYLTPVQGLVGAAIGVFFLAPKDDAVAK